MAPQLNADGVCADRVRLDYDRFMTLNRALSFGTAGYSGELYWRKLAVSESAESSVMVAFRDDSATSLYQAGKDGDREQRDDAPGQCSSGMRCAYILSTVFGGSALLYLVVVTLL